VRLVSAITVRSCCFLDLSLFSPYASHEIALMTSGRRWQGSIEHSSSRSTPCPRIAKSPISPLPLASSPDGRLSLHVANKLKISVSLLMRPTGAGADDGGWSRHAVIDITMTARSLTPPDTRPRERGAARSCCGRLPATWPTQRRPGRARSQHQKPARQHQASSPSVD